MRDRITFQKWFKTTDARFGEAGEWIPVATVWANVTPLDGLEQVNAQAVQSQISHSIKMRYVEWADPKYQIIYRGRLLDIVSVIDPDGRRRTLEIECREHEQVTT